eukprot:7734122-Karenia_brevis.AAC.1
MAWTCAAIMAYWLVVSAGPPGLQRPFLAICFRTKRPMERAGMVLRRLGYFAHHVKYLHQLAL